MLNIERKTEKNLRKTDILKPQISKLKNLSPRQFFESSNSRSYH